MLEQFLISTRRLHKDKQTFLWHSTLSFHKQHRSVLTYLIVSNPNQQEEAKKQNSSVNWLLSLGGKTKGGDLDSENSYS